MNPASLQSCYYYYIFLAAGALALRPPASNLLNQPLKKLLPTGAFAFERILPYVQQSEADPKTSAVLAFR
jgi:hypothetical protein